MIRHALRLAFCASVLVLLVPSAEAAVQHKLDAKVLAPLATAPKATGRLELKGVPLIDDRAETLILEEFDVLAADGVVRFHREDGQVVDLKPSPMRQYRGHVEGVPESLVYLSVSRRQVEGLVIVRERKFTVGSARRRGPLKPSVEGDALQDDVYIQEVSAEEDFAVGGSTFSCGVEGKMLDATTEMVPQSLALNASPKPVTNAAPTGTQRTMLNLVLQTDSKMYDNFSDDEEAVEIFVRNLVGAASTIYERDLLTMLRISFLEIRSDTDPWGVVLGANSTWDGVAVKLDTLHALLEYGDYLHNTPPTTVKRSASLLLSGMFESTGGGGVSFGGIAWTNNLCTNEALNTAPGFPFPYTGHWRGPYGFCGGMGVFAADRVVPDPEANPNFAAPADGYWPLLQFAHELGHTVQSPHTHCIDTNPAPETFTPIDKCFNGEGGCATGTQTLPAEKGTIMSYCHLTFGGANTRFTFGQPVELSGLVLTNMKARLAQKTPGPLSAIDAPGPVPVGVGGNTASVTNAGFIYDWTITNGTIDSGQGTNAITYTATADPVTLRVVATNTLGCSITDATTVTVEEAVAPEPPTGIVATATGANSVQITWVASEGATEYDVWRSAGGGSFESVGSAGGLLVFTDNTAAANTSYRYVVRAGTSGQFSTFSDDDVATTVVFTDPTLTVGSTKAKLVHFTEALTAVNALRTLAGIAPVSFTAPAPATNVSIRRAHLLDLRTGLDAARAVLGLPAISYTDAVITAQSTKIKAVHIDELRNGVR
jgi:hypothetical protein